MRAGEQCKWRTSRTWRSGFRRVTSRRLVTVALVGLLLAGVGVMPPPAFAADSCPEPNDTSDSACELRLDQPIEDELANVQDADRFRLTVLDGQSVEVTARSKVGVQKLRIEGQDGASIAEVGLGAGERRVVAERLPEGRYTVYLSADGGDPGQSFPYTITARAIGTGPVVSLASARGNLRDLTLTPADVGAQALQTTGRLTAFESGRLYEVVYERENTLTARRNGPMYILNRVHVAESAEKAQAIYNSWDVFDLPEAGPTRPYEFLGDQTMPGFGDQAHALGACVKCDDDNPLRSYRLVARFDTTIYLLYTWGRDASANFDVVMSLAFKMAKHLGLSGEPRGPSLALGLLAR